MSYQTIRDAIKTQLETVVGIAGGAGRVQTFKPRLDRFQKWKEFFGNDSGTLINGWTITRTGGTEFEGGNGFRYQVVHNIEVNFYHSLKNDIATEETFQDLIDAVKSTLRANVNIWIEHPATGDQAIQVPIIEEANFGGYLLHHATLLFSVEEFEVISS